MSSGSELTDDEQSADVQAADVQSDGVQSGAIPSADGDLSLDAIRPREGNGRARAIDGESQGNVAGTLDRNQPLEPGEINLENAAFVVLGVLLVVGLIGAAFFGF